MSASLAPGERLSEARWLAQLAVVRELAGRVRLSPPKSVEEITRGASSKDVADEALLLALGIDRRLRNAKFPELGVLDKVWVLGPFRDTGGGLDRKDGPEIDGTFGARDQRYSWGTVDVAWRPIPPRYASAKGIPLDDFILPRRETCTLVASVIHLTRTTELVVRAAAAGQAKLTFDRLELDRSDEVHALGQFDRLAGGVRADAGNHLIVVKTCSGALEDDGRVRVRVTDTSNEGVHFADRETQETLLDLSDTAPSKKLPSKIRTPLVRALTGESLPVPNKDKESELAKIVLRTLGGADDLKSPRAPGMLDAFTHRPDVRADELAMAGWVAPSGANRSAWLNLALDRARSERDVATIAFVERRIVAQRSNGRMPEWAKETIDRAETWGKDNEARLLEAGTTYALGSEGNRLRALDLARSVATQADAPLAALHIALPYARQYDPPLALDLLERLAARSDFYPDWVERLGTKGRAALVAAADRAMASDIDSGRAEQIGSTLANVGEHDRSRALFRTLIERLPNRASLWSHLHEELLATNSDPRFAEIALERARELEPTALRTRKLLAMGQRTTSPKVAQDDERYLVSAETILARRKGPPAPGSAPPAVDREIHWLRAVKMHPDHRVSQLIHYAKEIIVAPRTEDELVEDIPREGDLTEILRARVHRRTGGIATPTEEREDGGRPFVRWPELQPGDVVEVAIRTWTGGPVGGRGDPPYYFMDYGGAPSAHPLLYNEVVVESSKDRPIHVDLISGTSDRREETDRGDVHVTRLIWDHPKVIQEEPLAPPMAEAVPVVVGSTFKDWSAFRVWYAEAVRGFTEPDDQVKRLSKELTKGKTSRDAKIKALFDFVADNIRYVNFVSGEAWLPNRPQQLLARREGDCDDKAILLITLLRTIGVEAQEVLVQTRETAQPSVLRAKHAAVPLFDHGIAFLPGPNGGTYLDATSPQSRLGPIPSMDARAVALRMDSGPAEIVTLPVSSPSDHGSEVQWDVQLSPEGMATISGDEEHVGDGAFWLRSNLTESDSRLQYVEENLIAPWVPNVVVEKGIQFRGDLPGGKALVRYKARSAGLLRSEGTDLVLRTSSGAPLATQLAPLVMRTQPVWLPSHLAPSHQTRHLRISAPLGWEWSDLPAGGSVHGGEFGHAEFHVVLDPRDKRVALVKRTLVLDAHVISPAKYASWRKFLQDVDAMMRSDLRLVKKGGK